MPRQYKRKLGSRRYADYTPEALESCLNAIKAGMNTRLAADTYNIPRRTLFYKLKGLHMKKPGFPPIFSYEEERRFVLCIQSLSDFGFPVTEVELRQIIKTYLNRQGKKIARFRDNIPGKDWVKKFLLRHKDLTTRLASNIKRSRAALNKEQMLEYIENLKQTLIDVEPHAIFNYDETNLTDDPGQKKIITKRGVKYPERICNSSKSSISLMIAGSAAGELLPPYVVYKSKHLWDTWTENGPPGTRYGNTASGWFESQTFSDWFTTLLLPRLKKIPGKKVVIGDNLSSHINVDVLDLCRKHDVHFVCLPPNSTHVTQPLDVGFFAPLKRAWRELLSRYKETHVGSRSNVLEKQHFPTLLRSLMEKIGENAQDVLKASFKKCGVVPCDATPLLERLNINHQSTDRINEEANNNTPQASDIQNSFIDYLQEKRQEATQFKLRGKKKKLTVPPGQSIAHSEANLIDIIEASCSTSKQNRDEHVSDEDTDLADDGVPPACFENSSDDDIDEIQEIEEEIEFNKKLDSGTLGNGPENLKQTSLKTVIRAIGEHVLFIYEDNVYPGVITSVDEDGALINAMVKSLKFWKWPQRRDEIWYSWDKIIGSINPPKQISKRGLYAVPECDKLWWD